MKNKQDNDQKKIQLTKIKTKIKEKKDETNSLNILHYENYETLRVYNKNKRFYEETDVRFLRDVKRIVKVRENAIMNILNINKSRLTDQQCDELDYRARLHAMANIVNQNTKFNPSEVDQEYRCQCGCNRCRGDYIPFCANEQNLNVLGPGVLLLFLFKKSTAAILVSIVVIYALFSFITNLMGAQSSSFDSCNGDPYCQFKCLASDENKSTLKNYRQIQQWLGLAFCVVWILMVRAIKYVGQQKDRIIDMKVKSASDYAILIQNLPISGYEQKQLIGYFEGFWDKVKSDIESDTSKDENERAQMLRVMGAKEGVNQFKMKSIQIIYNMKFSREMVESIFQLCYILDGLLVQEEEDQKKLIQRHQQYRVIKNKLKQTYELLFDLRKKFLNQPQFRKGLATTCCLIQFKNQKIKNIILQYFGIQKVGIIKRIQAAVKNCFGSYNRNILFKGKVLTIERAPQPSDIMWLNCEKKKSLSRITVIYLATFLIITVSFAMITALNFLQSYTQQKLHVSNSVSTVINLAISVGLLIINKLLWSSLFYLLQLQFNHTLTQKIISQMNKVMFLSLINVIVLPIVSSYIVQIVWTGEGKGFTFGNLGLAGLAFDYHLSCIIQVLTKIFNPVLIIKKVLITIRWLRYRLIRFLVSHPAKVDFVKGASQVNKFYQGQNFDIAENYVYLLTAILHAVFFCQLQPFIILMVTVMAGLFYFVNRVILIRVCKIPQLTDYLIFDTAIYMLGFVPICFGVGAIVLTYFQNQERSSYPFQYIGPGIAIGLGILALMNPCDILNIIAKKIIKCLPCIDINELLGEYDEDDADDDQSDADDDSESSLDVKSKDLAKYHKKTKKGGNRLESYHEESNSLTLLGFEKLLKGNEQKEIASELQLFCQSFFPKLQIIDQNDNQNMSTKRGNQVLQTEGDTAKILDPPLIQSKKSISGEQSQTYKNIKTTK